MTIALRPNEMPRGMSRDVPRQMPEPVPVHDAQVLTDGGQQARIVLDGKVYLLRITRAGKLILTK